MDGKQRKNICVGAPVEVVLKKDQPTGRLTRGHVQRILTNSATHPHGIKVMLRETDAAGKPLVGRVQHILTEGVPETDAGGRDAADGHTGKI